MSPTTTPMMKKSADMWSKSHPCDSSPHTRMPNVAATIAKMVPSLQPNSASGSEASASSAATRVRAA